MRFNNQCAFVTGGASGIGLAIVERLVAEGGNAWVADANAEALANVAQKFSSHVACREIDVRNEGQVADAVTACQAQFDKIDMAFNCAGLSVPGEIVDLSEADWDTTVDICLKGVFLSVKHEARAMRKDGGAIVNIASLNSQVPMIGGAAYACAKAGVEMLSRNAALELAPDNIRVNTVSPGLTDTPLTAGIRDLQGAEAAYMERIPMQRWGTPADMAAAALFLASDDAAYISGTNLFVDGAWATTAYPNLRPFLNELQTPSDTETS